MHMHVLLRIDNTDTMRRNTVHIASLDACACITEIDNTLIQLTLERNYVY